MEKIVRNKIQQEEQKIISEEAKFFINPLQNDTVCEKTDKRVVKSDITEMSPCTEKSIEDIVKNYISALNQGIKNNLS